MLNYTTRLLLTLNRYSYKKFRTIHIRITVLYVKKNYDYIYTVVQYTVYFTLFACINVAIIRNFKFRTLFIIKPYTFIRRGSKERATEAMAPPKLNDILNF